MLTTTCGTPRGPRPTVDGSRRHGTYPAQLRNRRVRRGGASNGIDSSVVVQTIAGITETEELLELAAASTLVAGVVGWVDVGAPDVGDQLDRLLARPSGSWLVGIRSLAQYEPDPAWLARPAVLAGLREVARRGLCNDLSGPPTSTQRRGDCDTRGD